MSSQQHVTTSSDGELAAPSRSTRRRFLRYLGAGAAGTALVSGAQALSPLAALAATRNGTTGVARFSPSKEKRSTLMNNGSSQRTSNKLSIVFAHGLWADGSCFNKLIPTLQAEGHEVISAQNSLDSLAGDVAAVRRALDQVSSPAILVGHSQGGTIITAAGTDERVAGLVFISALAPDESETAGSLLAKFPPAEVLAHTELADGHIWLRRDGIEYFAGDLSEQEQKLVWATQGVPVADLLTQKVAGVAWRSKPSWYIVAKDDRTVNPDLERFVAKRMGATTYEVDSSHVIMLSHPGFVLDVIRSAVNAIQGSLAR